MAASHPALALVVLGEFAEDIGPVVRVHVGDPRGVDLDALVLRMMSVDVALTQPWAATLALPSLGASALVLHGQVADVHARGHVRALALAYVAAEPLPTAHVLLHGRRCLQLLQASARRRYQREMKKLEEQEPAQGDEVQWMPRSDDDEAGSNVSSGDDSDAQHGRSQPARAGYHFEQALRPLSELCSRTWDAAQQAMHTLLEETQHTPHVLLTTQATPVPHTFRVGSHAMSLSTPVRAWLPLAPGDVPPVLSPRAPVTPSLVWFAACPYSFCPALLVAALTALPILVLADAVHEELASALLGALTPFVPSPLPGALRPYPATPPCLPDLATLRIAVIAYGSLPAPLKRLCAVLDLRTLALTLPTPRTHSLAALRSLWSKFFPPFPSSVALAAHVRCLLAEYASTTGAYTLRLLLTRSLPPLPHVPPVEAAIVRAWVQANLDTQCHAEGHTPSLTLSTAPLRRIVHADVADKS